ncbi:MAG: ABC transporter substrate-binding protein [Candidatus Dormibacteraeota bacterium]|nr:ABC transporter substrate-binding protein [Candidatus Dormibacteraeota bacterium]
MRPSTLIGGGNASPLRRRLPKVVSFLAVGAIGLTACGSTAPSGGGGPANTDLFNPANFNTSNVPWLSANQNASGSPVKGGTLKIVGSTDLTAFGDPQGEYDTTGYMLERAYTRQLVTYPASTDLTTADSLVPDAAAAMPAISSDGLTYTFKLRSGLVWNTSPPRPVTSQDFVLGLKRNCDPTLAPNGNPGYFASTIAGFKEFCDPFQAQDPTESAAARAAYINGTNISGLKTPDNNTLEITLTQPASDFNNILALGFGSAAPVEYLSVVPLTPGNTLYSDGPYFISKYDVTHSITLDRNPQWQQSTDQVRHQYVDSVQIQVDLSGSAADAQVQQDIAAGTADLQFNNVVPTADLTSLTKPTRDPRFGSFPTPGNTNPFLVFDTLSPNNNGALKNVKVRQALEYALDKVALAKIYGGTDFNQVLNQVLAPGAEGYQQYNPYPTPNNQGDPAKCKSLLAAAGVTNLTLKDLYRDNGKHPAVFQQVQNDFGKCGVTTTGVPISQGYYGSKGIGGKSGSTGSWDITEPGWVPDWFGPNNGRGTIPDLFDGQTNYPGTDWSGYDNPATDALINQALAAKSQSEAADLWHKADVRIMADAPFIPFMTQLTNLFRSTRVHNAIFFPFGDQYDITQIWLS